MTEQPPTKPSEYNLLCPTCNESVESYGEPDGIGTQFYKCQNGHIMSKPTKQEITPEYKFVIRLIEANKVFEEELKKYALNPSIDKVLLDDVHRTVASQDDHVVKANLYTALSAYNDPVNNSIKAESGAGKTYVTLASIEYIPQEDVVIIGTQSPKVISHEKGELMTGNDEPFCLEDAPRKPLRRDYETLEDFVSAIQEYKIAKNNWDEKVKQSYHVIKLGNKILVFLENISFETFEMFKTVLSHDEPFKAKRIPHKYVDDKGNVHLTILDGVPSTIFCSIDKNFIAEFSTRTFTVSPSTEKEKIQVAKQITSKKKAFPWDYEEETKDKAMLKALIKCIRDTFKKLDLKVIIPFLSLEKLFSDTATRDMRDFNHFLEILPAFAMLKMYQRPIVTVKGKNYLVVSVNDVKEAKALFDEIEQTTKTGTERKIIEFYDCIVKPKIDGMTLEALVEEYNIKNPKNTLSDYRIRWMLKRLNQIGWVQIKKGEVCNDKRKDKFYPLKDVNQPTQTKICETSGVSKTQLDLDCKLQSDFKKWITTICENGVVAVYGIIEFLGSSEHPIITPITVEEFTRKILGIDNTNSQIVDKLIVEGEIENEPKTNGFYETQSDSQNNYVQPCYFCGKPIVDEHRISDDFTENKPAHRKCYDDHRAQLKESSQ